MGGKMTKTAIRNALKTVLDQKDPEDKHGKRKVITWPMADFRRQIRRAAEINSIKDVSFEFTQEQIEKQLTTAIIKTDSRTIKLSYDYKTDSVDCFCVGKDLDPIRTVINVSKCSDFIRQYAPPKKRIVIRRKV